MNRHLLPEVETLFLTPAEQYGFISSSLVREISRLGGDVSAFVPAAVYKELQAEWQRIAASVPPSHNPSRGPPRNTPPQHSHQPYLQTSLFPPSYTLTPV